MYYANYGNLMSDKVKKKCDYKVGLKNLYYSCNIIKKILFNPTRWTNTTFHIKSP